MDLNDVRFSMFKQHRSQATSSFLQFSDCWPFYSDHPEGFLLPFNLITLNFPTFSLRKTSNCQSNMKSSVRSVMLGSQTQHKKLFGNTFSGETAENFSLRSVLHLHGDESILAYKFFVLSNILFLLLLRCGCKKSSKTEFFITHKKKSEKAKSFASFFFSSSSQSPLLWWNAEHGKIDSRTNLAAVKTWKKNM